MAECQEVFYSLIELLQELGFDISWHRVVPPTQCLSFLGVLIDTVSQTLSLPSDKLVELQDIVQAFPHIRRANKRQLKSLAGKLSWACKVVYGGRTFLRRILDVMNSLLSPRAKYPLSEDFYAEFSWWASFLKLYNSKQLFLDHKPIVEVQTDACFDSMGAFYAGDWTYVHFVSALPIAKDLHINYKETLAIVMAAERWGPAWNNKRVIIDCDNQPAVSIINKGSTHNSIVMSFLRRWFWLSVILISGLQLVTFLS